MLLLKALKQMDDRSCLTTCLAMIVEEPIEYVDAWFDGSNGHSADDAIIFLAHHGIFLAMYAIPGDGNEYMTLGGKEDLDFKMCIVGRPALVTVLSERFEGKLHAVLWDGEKVFDPSPLVIGPRSLDSYKIVEIWPLLLTEQRGKTLMGGLRKNHESFA